MTLPTLHKLKEKWDTLRSNVLKQPEKSRRSRKTRIALKQFLEECIEAGKYISNSIDRADLQWIARQVGDVVFWYTNEYPKTAILPFEPTIAAKTTETELSETTPSWTKRKLWNVPLPCNPFFTGRQEILDRLQKILLPEGTVALAQPQAITGLGGIGKTQVALAYACKHRERYQAVLWVMAETRESLVSGFVAIARLLGLPGNDAQDQHHAVTAVRRWLESEEGWLLILDNADDLEVVQAFIPYNFKGHLVLTSRAHATGGLAQALAVDTMPEEDGALLLLRRTKLLSTQATFHEATTEDREQAKALCRALDGLPLALDQAGAYIEKTGCGLVGYRELFLKRGTELLAERGQAYPKDHPASVTTTWSLSFEKLEQASPPAAELLCLCAFLHADEIPEELFTEAGDALGNVLGPVAADPLAWDRALSALRNYSLLRRNADTQTLDIHRLVQVVLKARMDETEQYQRAERAVRAVNRVFPNPEEFTHWPRCNRLLPQALRCAELIKTWDFEFEEAGRLLNNTAFYLHKRARYEEAEPLYKSALEIRKKALGQDHPDVGWSLNTLAFLYYKQGRYQEAEPLYRQALTILDKALGPNHPDVGWHFNDLAELYRAQGRYEEAECLCRKALAIRTKVMGLDHPDVGWSLNTLADLYYDQGRYEEAEPRYKRALEISEKTLGAENKRVAALLNSLAELYRAQGRYEEAEPLFKRALAIVEKVLEPEHPHVVKIKENYAHLLSEKSRGTEAGIAEAPADRRSGE